MNISLPVVSRVGHTFSLENALHFKEVTVLDGIIHFLHVKVSIMYPLISSDRLCLLATHPLIRV